MTPINADELTFDDEGGGAIGADDLPFDQPAPRPKKRELVQPKKPTLGEMQERAQTFKPLQDPAPGYDLRFDQEPGGVVLQFPAGDSFKPQGITMGDKGAGKLKPRLAGVRREEGESLDSFLKRSEAWRQGEQARKRGERAELAQVRAKTTPSRGPIGRVAEGFKTGFGEAIRTTAVGAKLVTGQEPNDVGLEQPLPTMNEEDAKGWLNKGGQGLGSMIPFMLGSAAIGPTAVTLMGAAQNAGQTYEEARAKGVSHDEALAAAIPGALIGALEGIGGGGGKATGFLKGTLGEGGQEGLTQVLNNINAKFVSGYDPQRAITEGVFDSVILGGLLGAGVHGVGAALTGQPPAIPTAAEQLDARLVRQVEGQTPVEWSGDVRSPSVNPVNPSFVSDPIERQANLLAWHEGADSRLKGQDGLPIPVYHGTQSPVEIEQLDATKLDSDAWYGPGLYTTEDPSMGSTYAANQSPLYGSNKITSKLAAQLREAGIEVEDNATLSSAKNLLAGAFFGHQTISEKSYIELRNLLDQQGRSAVYKFHINLQNPFDIEANPGVYDQMVEEENGDKIAVKNRLQAMGYDGITHIDYGQVGIKGEGPEHRVWIVFKPEQIKSATGNEGTFDRNDPRLSASFTPDQLLEMEQRAAQAGRPVALRPVTVQSFHQQIGAIQQELMRVDPTSPEFARLADRAVQLRRAVEEAPTPADLKDGKSMREWARKQNMWHDAAAQDLLDLLGITDESGTDTSLPGIKTNWDLYHRRVKSGERGARFYPLPANNNKGGTVFLSPQSMVDAGVIEAEEVGKIGGMNVSLNIATDYARLAELGGHVDVAVAIRGAIREAQEKGLPKIALAMYVPGQGLKTTKQFLRHESFHTGQQVAANAAAPPESVGWNDPTALVSTELLYHPIVAKVARTEGGQSVLAYYDGDQSALAFEMAAYAAAKQYNELGWTKEEADEYLADYLLDVLETSGVEALEGLAKGARLSAPVAQQVTKLTENYYGRERTRRDRANSFAASLRAPSSTAGPEGAAGKGGGTVGEVGEGGGAEGGVEGKVDGVSERPSVDKLFPRDVGVDSFQSRKERGEVSDEMIEYEKKFWDRGYGSEENIDTPGLIVKKITVRAGDVIPTGRPLTGKRLLTAADSLREDGWEYDSESEQSAREADNTNAIVIRDLDRPGKWIAMEGNHRITVMNRLDPDALIEVDQMELGDEVPDEQARDYGELDADNLARDEEDLVGAELAAAFAPQPVEPPNQPPSGPSPVPGKPGSPLTEEVLAKTRYEELRQQLLLKAVKGGYKYDPLVPPGIQLAQAIEKGHLDLDSIAEEMAKSGMSVNDLANLAEFTQHRAGQILNELSKLSKTVRDLIQTNPVAATAIVGPNKVMQEGLKILERTELGHSMWERMGNVMRKNFLSRLSTTFTQVWSTTGQIPMDIASGAIAGLVMRRLNPARWQSNTKGMLARAKEDVTRGVLPVITLARGMNPKQVGDLIKLQTPSQQAEYRQMVDDLSLLHPELYGKLHGREDLALSAPGFMSPAMLRQVLPMVQDPAKRREFEVKLRTLEGRERINKSIVGKAFKGYEKALDIVLWPLSVQEYAFRRPMFIGALQRELEAKGHDLNAFIADPSSVAGAKDILQSAVDEALRFTWAYEPKEGNKAVGQTEQAMEGAASYFIKFWNKLGPIGATLEAFPRALTNGLKFAYEWSPFGFISPAWQVQDKLRHGARDQITFQEAQRMSQAVVGTAMYGLALGLREWAGGEEWWQIKTGKKTKDGKPVYYDARRIPQLAFFLNAADLAKRASEDRLGDIKVEQRLKDTYLGARRNSQPGDLGAIDQFMLMWTGDTVPTNAKQRSQLAAGQWASTFVIPLSNIRDAWAQFNEQEGAKRDLREQPWLGPSLDKLPWLRRNLPLAEGPFEPSPQGANYAPIAEGEGVGPITGAFALAGATGAAKFTPGQSFAAQEFARLGLSPYTWLKRDPDPAIDRAQWKRMTTILQAIGNSLANSESYRNQSPDQQRAIWESIIGGAEGAAAEAKAAGLETNPMEAERRKTLQAVPPYQRKAIGLDKKLAPMQQP